MGYFCTETMIFWDSRTFWVILVVCQITEIRACRMMGSPASSWCLQRRSGMPATIQPMYIGYPPEINQSNGKSPMNGHSNGNIIFKRVIFHCNVWFPEGKLGQVGDDFFVAKWSKDAQACQACPGCFFLQARSAEANCPVLRCTRPGRPRIRCVEKIRTLDKACQVHPNCKKWSTQMDPNKEHALGLEPHGHKEKSFASCFRNKLDFVWNLCTVYP